MEFAVLLGNRNFFEKVCGGKFVKRDVTSKQFAHLQRVAVVRIGSSLAEKLLAIGSVRAVVPDSFLLWHIHYHDLVARPE